MLGNSHCNLTDKEPSGCIRPWRWCAFIARHRGQWIVWPSTMNEPPLSDRSWQRSAFVSVLVVPSMCCCDCISGVRHFFNKSIGCLTMASDRSPKRTAIRYFDTARAAQFAIPTRHKRERESLIGDTLFSGRQSTCFVTNNPNFITARTREKVEIACMPRARFYCRACTLRSWFYYRACRQ